eukprot:TRINITY_DN2069_c0_g2_i1.p1 TRINITY_DN2069_c0_g2~~TRINITY_DN2069_c0_g2_i1.p1  ORF type:complete len:432 (-),score=165.13 TRINITY_DN2069_c0_g2_i1:144-1439(-)
MSDKKPEDPKTDSKPEDAKQAFNWNFNFSNLSTNAQGGTAFNWGAAAGGSSLGGPSGTTLGGDSAKPAGISSLTKGGSKKKGRKGGKRGGKGGKSSGPKLSRRAFDDDDDDDDEEDWDDDMMKQNLLKLVNSKFGDMMGQSSGYIETLPKEVQSRIKALQDLNKEATEVDKKLEAEVRALEIKFHKEYAPIFIKRKQIITGEVEPPVEEPQIQEITDAGEPVAPATDPVKGIPEFWLIALKNNPLFEDAITESDEPALKFLHDITYDPMPEESGSFLLNFNFGENPYFTNTILTKTYHINSEAEGDVICDSIDATKIVWKEGQDLTKGKEGRLGEPTGSFFMFFAPPDLEAEDVDEDDVGTVELDFEMAATLKDRIIHNAVDWFTGDIYSEMGDDDDDDDLFGGGKYDEDDDDDYDPDDDEGPPPQECKQQ